MRALACTSLAALALAGCYRVHTFTSSDAGLADAFAPHDAFVPRDAFVPPDAAPSLLVFRRCDGAFGARSFGVEVECATTAVPRMIDDPAAGSVTLTVERIRAPSGAPRAQLWMLQGGPGGASLAFETYASIVQRAMPEVEILLVDHRGTGLADRLGCDSEESVGSAAGTTITADEWPSCIASLRARDLDLRQYSSTSAAHDLDLVIERARRPGVPVFVYGVSYGTYWAQRWMQVGRARVDGVILDSICSPGECTFPIGYSRGYDEVGRELLRACERDAACRSRVGAGDVVAWAEGVLARIDSGACPAATRVGLDGEGVRVAMGILLRDGQLRQAIPALFHRLDRCAAEDAPAFASLSGLLLGEPVGDELSRLANAPVLTAAVIRSEMWESPPPTESAYRGALAAMLFDAPIERGLGTFASLDSTPTYVEPPLAFVTTDVPLLMMNGSLDPQTTLADARPTGEHYAGPAQYFVVFDRAPHGTLFTTSYDPARPEVTCGMDVAARFVADPTAPLDTSCRTETARLDFDAPDISGALFGTTSLWEARLAPPAPSASLTDARARIRRIATSPW